MVAGSIWKLGLHTKHTPAAPCLRYAQQQGRPSHLLRRGAQRGHRTLQVRRRLHRLQHVRRHARHVHAPAPLHQRRRKVWAVAKVEVDVGGQHVLLAVALLNSGGARNLRRDGVACAPRLPRCRLPAQHRTHAAHHALLQMRMHEERQPARVSAPAGSTLHGEAAGNPADVQRRRLARPCTSCCCHMSPHMHSPTPSLPARSPKSGTPGRARCGLVGRAGTRVASPPPHSPCACCRGRPARRGRGTRPLQAASRVGKAGRCAC